MSSQITIVTSLAVTALPKPLVDLSVDWHQKQVLKNRYVYRASVETSVAESLKPQLDELRKGGMLDISILENAPDISIPGVLLMDMDSTVIDMECIDELAKLAGVGEEVSAVTEAAMRGELDFAESLRGRVGTLAGADVSILNEVGQRLPLNPGVENLVSELKKKGWIVAIASGGFTYFANILKQRLGLDFIIANELEITDGKLTGKVLGDVIDANVKAQTIEALRVEHGIAQSQTVAMGDGANDLVMMEQAALGVAYRAKPIVAAQADASIEFFGLDNLLWMLERP